MANRETQIVFAAYKDDLVIAIAGAGAVTDKLWEVGIVVNPSCRNNGLATALTRKLTFEIMRQGIVPFYSASITNVGPQMVAQRAGYIPYWIDSFGNIFDKNYAYDYEAVIKAIKNKCEVCK